MKGTVKFYNREKRFGFIAGEDGKEFFVHESGIKSGSLNENDPVTFDVEDGERGPKAVNVAKGDSSSTESTESTEDSSSSEDNSAEEEMSEAA
tara:strand:+ start:80 stop:358 length:279 start_codon:yes stop_codon:yes gene_type:complete